MKAFCARSVLGTQRDRDIFKGVVNYDYDRHIDLFVSAKDKVEALAIASRFGYRIRPVNLKIALGNDIEAITKAQLLTPQNMIFVQHNGEYVGAASMDTHGNVIANLIGAIKDSNTYTCEKTFFPIK